MKLFKIALLLMSLVFVSNAQVKKTASTSAVTSKSIVTKKATVTYYCLKSNRMANGKRVAPGYVAADIRYYKMGSRIYLNGVPYIVGDTGSDIRGPHRFDVWVKSCSSALKLGRKKMFLEL